MVGDTLLNMNMINVTIPQNQTTWKSCCLEVDKSALKYIIQISILASLIVTSCTMLVVDGDCNQQRTWSGILTLCLGILVPCPNII